jgi:YidC/Oxa1 family membrane protein insertase
MEKKEMSMETRLLIFFVLMGLILLGTQYFYKPPPPPAKPAAVTSTANDKAVEKEAVAAAQPAAQTAAAAQATPPVDMPGRVQAEKEETVTVETDLYRVTFSNRGAVAKSWTLKAYKDHEGKPVELINPRLAGRVRAPLSLVLKHPRAYTVTAASWANGIATLTVAGQDIQAGQEISVASVTPAGYNVSSVFAVSANGTQITYPVASDPGPYASGGAVTPESAANLALFKVDQSADRLAVDFEFSDGRTVVKKSFHFAPDSYLIAVNTEVTQNGVMAPHEIAWRGGFGDQTVSTAAADEHAVYFDTKLQTKEAKEAKNGPAAFGGQLSFEGMEDKFFAGVFLPSSRTSSEITVFSDSVPTATVGTDEQRAGVGFGGEGLNMGALFVGPKDSDLLAKVDPRLEQLIDWGWFKLLAEPLFLALHWTSEHVTHNNYGWAIIFVTITINIILSPLSLQQLKSSRKMQKIQPQIAALNARYKGIKMNDPRKAEQNQEMMDLYKREGVNPMGGCLPMLIQFPFLLAFYRVLSVSIAMRGASWLWVHDLSQPETLAIRVLPVLLVVTQFLTQKMTPTPGVDPSQQKMMMITPLIFGYIFYFLSSGLVLYYLTSNFVAIARQMILNRISGPITPPSPTVIDVKPTSPKKRR